MAFMVQEANLVDPVQCFGIYLVLQGFFFVAALQMSKDLEPGEISEFEAQAQEASNEEGSAGQAQQEAAEEEAALLPNQDVGEAAAPAPKLSSWELFALNVKLIWRALQHKEIYQPLIFFITTGFLIPNLEDALYYFLLDTCGLSK